MSPERWLQVGVLIAVVLAAPAPRPGGRAKGDDPRIEALVPLISLVKTGDLNFGELVTGVTSGTVTVTPAGARSATGGTTLGNSSTARAASFTVSAAPLIVYHVTLPASATITTGSTNMTVNTFTSSPSGIGQVGLGGTQTLTVGARLNVGANQAAGNYTGTFNVTVAIP